MRERGGGGGTGTSLFTGKREEGEGGLVDISEDQETYLFGLIGSVLMLLN